MSLKKTLLVGVGGLVGVLVLAIAGAYAYTESLRDREIQFSVKDFDLVMEEDLLARGQKLTITRGCVDCHDTDLGGKLIVDDPAVGRFMGSNLTAGVGGVAADYLSNADWDRAIRYGVAPGGRPLLFMPSNEFHTLSRKDTAALIAYIRSVPPVDRETTPQSPGPLARVLHVAGQFPLLFPVDLLPDRHEQADDIPLEVSPEYGKYLAASCFGCHGESYKGGPIPGAPPEWPPAADITATGRIASWTLAQFRTALRTGVTPDGRHLDPVAMPWPNFGQLNDEELEAVYLFLTTLP